MDLIGRMKIFIAVVEAGQFTRAAAHLNMSKSAVSHGIRELETYLDIKLLARDNRNVQVTEAGEEYYDHCAGIVGQITETEDRMRGREHAIAGRIRISAPPAYIVNILAPVISEFMNIHKNVDIEIHSTENFENLVESGLDFAIRIGDLTDSALIARKIAESELVLCASPSYLKAYPSLETVADLEVLNCLRYTRTPNWQLTDNSGTVEFVPKGNFVTNSGDILGSFVRHGIGITYIPHFLIASELASGALVRLLPKYAGRTLNVHAVRHPIKQYPMRVKMLIDHLAQALSPES